MKEKLFKVLNKIVAVETNYELRIAKTVMAYLELSYLFYQSAHWQTKGSDFYGDHLLFQRLYEGVREEVDGLGEKLVGVYGVENVDIYRRLQNIVALSNFLTLEYIQKEYIGTSLLLEEKILDLLQEADSLEFSSGTKDLFAGFADTHEGHLFLLKQRQTNS